MTLPIVMANMGGAFLWATILHLTLGNLLLGVVEGGALAAWLRLKTSTAIFRMIGANILSAWIGVTLIRSSYGGGMDDYRWR